MRDPESWVRERLSLHPWSGQVRAMEAVRDNRKTAIPSCHSAGKSFSASLIAAWWLDCHVPGSAFVVTTAPTGPQVSAVLWREMRRLHSKGLYGRVNQTEWYMEPYGGGAEELVAIGRKPNDYEPTAFHGIHAPYVLVIGDEACGLPTSLLEAADSLISNDDGKMLLIGNPDIAGSEFEKACTPGSPYFVVAISAFDTPNFTGEPVPQFVASQLIGWAYVEEKRRKWAPDWRWVDYVGPYGPARKCIPPEGADEYGTNPYWQSKILGRFPRVSGVESLIPADWILRAQNQSLPAVGPSELGVDVGGGGDSSTICHRIGPLARIVNEDWNPDTMHTCGVVIAQLEATGASVAKVDKIGIGWGVVDRGIELEKPFVGINVGQVADEEAESEAEERFANLRAQYWWLLRQRFESGTIDIDPQDEDLAAELAAIRFERRSDGKIIIESKDKMKKRGQPSPNRADALMLAFCQPRVEPGGVLAGEAVW